MKRWRGLALVVGGGLVGSVLTALMLGAIWPSHPAVLQHLPDPLVARVLMTRTASTIVSYKRYPDAPSAGVTLYSRPIAVSASLCLVRAYYFDSQGGADVTGSYALLKEPVGSVSPVDVLAAPAGADRTAGAAEQECANYRDFQHLIAGDQHEIAEVFHLLQQARDAAVGNRPDFAVDCLSKVESREGRPCDGLSYIRSLELKKIGEVGRAGELRIMETDSRTYWVTITDYRHDHPLVTMLTVSTHSPDNLSEIRVKSISIERDAY